MDANGLQGIGTIVFLMVLFAVVVGVGIGYVAARIF